MLEVWEYQYNAARQTYERVCYRPIQICEPEDNPIDNIEELNLFPAQQIRVEDLDQEVQDFMRSSPNEETRRVPPQRPPPPNFRSSAVDVLSGDDPQHAIVVESPASPDRSPSTTPVDTPTKRRAPSPPPVSPSRVRCESPVYIPLEDHIYALPECTNNYPGDDPRLGMRPAPERQRRRAPSPPRSNQPTERERNHQRQRNHQPEETSSLPSPI